LIAWATPIAIATHAANEDEKKEVAGAKGHCLAKKKVSLTFTAMVADHADLDRLCHASLIHPWTRILLR
jgi:hypothetical protein